MSLNADNLGFYTRPVPKRRAAAAVPIPTISIYGANYAGNAQDGGSTGGGAATVAAAKSGPSVAMSKAGASETEILRYYYPGVTFRNVY